MDLQDIIKATIELPKDVYPIEVPKILDHISKKCNIDIDYKEIMTTYSSINPKKRPRGLEHYMVNIEYKGTMQSDAISFTCLSCSPDMEKMSSGENPLKALEGRISQIRFSGTKDKAAVLTDIRNKVAEYFAKKARKKH